MKTIYRKDIKEGITLVNQLQYGNIELFTKVQGIEVYNCTIWGLTALKFNEDGTIVGTINYDPTAIIIHNVQRIEILQTTPEVNVYRIYSEMTI